MVVTVSNYSKHETKDGRAFITLELTGGLEFVLSSATGKQYATVRKCSIPSTFDEAVAKSLVGSQLPGAVVRVSCEPYEYVKKSTGEVMVLDYNYAYQASLQSETVGHSKVQDLQIA